MRRLKRFVAEDWPFRIWIAGVVMAWFVFLKGALNPDRTLFSAWQELAAFIGIAAAGLVISILIAGMAAGVFVAPINRIQARLNGAPFKPGDRVLILAGRYRGRIGRVYSEWQGETIRVDVGDEASKTFDDVFGQYQVERVANSAEEPRTE